MADKKQQVKKASEKENGMGNDKHFNDKHFTIDAGSVKAALTAVGKDKMCPMLDCLHVKVGVSGSGDKRYANVTIDATDSYRLIRVLTHSVCVGKDLEDAEFNVAGVKVQSAAKWVDFDLSGSDVTVRALNGKTSEASLCHAFPTSTAVYRKMDGTFPNVGQLITYKEKAVTGVCVNPKYLGDVAKAAQALEAKSVQFMGATEHKLTGGKVSVGGVRWTMHGGDGICAEYIVMPVRDREWELMFAGGTNADREKNLLKQLEDEVAEKVRLGKELEDMRQKYEELKATKPVKAESDCDVCAAKANYENAKKQLADLQEKYDELLKTERKVTQQKDAATQELGQLKEKLARKKPNKATKEQIEQAQAEARKPYADKVSELEREIKQLNGTIEKYQGKYADALVECKSAVDEVERLKHELEGEKEEKGMAEVVQFNAPVNKTDLAIGVNDDGSGVQLDNESGNLTGRILIGWSVQGEKYWPITFNGKHIEKAKCLFIYGAQSNEKDEVQKSLRGIEGFEDAEIEWAPNKKCFFFNNPFCTAEQVA